MSFAINMAGDHLAAGAPTWASKWVINNAKIKASVRKVKAAMPLNLELTLGDFGALGASENTFELIDVNSALLTQSIPGDFCKLKNKVFFWADDVEYIENLVESLIRAQPNVDWFTINYFDGGVSATINKEKLTVSGTIRFNADIAYMDGTEAYNVKGSFNLSGKGVPAQ